MELSTLREKLAQKKGPTFWKSLEEVAETTEFKAYLEQEYPNGVVDFEDPTGRREFLKLMGFSLVMSFLSGCTKKAHEKIIPYVKDPKGVIPGKPQYFATSYPMNGHSIGLLATNHLGRPTKIEGNPDHPDSLGATNGFAQAEILNLYDPDRSQDILKSGIKSNWEQFSQAVLLELKKQQNKQGSGIHLLTETIISPTLYDQIQQLLVKFPQAKWYQYDPVNLDQSRIAQKNILNQYYDPIYHFDQADRILSIDCNIISDLPGSIRYSRELIQKRKSQQSNRIYTFSATPNLTTALADHHFPTHANNLYQIVAYIAMKAGIQIKGFSTQLNTSETENLDLIWEDLSQHSGKSVVIAGSHLPYQIQEVIYAINEKLQNYGKTIEWIKPIQAHPTIQIEELSQLSKNIQNQSVEMLLILGGNPAYTAPSDIPINQLIKTVPFTIHSSLFVDETSKDILWHIPQNHFLEIFSDSKASDGTISMIQPSIYPLYNGKSHHQLLELFLENSDTNDYDIVRNYWKKQWIGINFEKTWRQSIHDGVVQNSKHSTINPNLKINFNWENIQIYTDRIQLAILPDPNIWDGQFSNNGWLQELPKPLTKLCWDNAAWISPKMAEQFQLSNGDLIQIDANHHQAKLPVWIVPTHGENSITLFMGYGRNFRGQVGYQIGTNVNPFKTSQNMHLVSAKITKLFQKYPLATTQYHHNMYGRDIIRQKTVADANHVSHETSNSHHADMSMYPKFKYDDNKWGMVIDLSSCTGCNACVVSCQSENNVPIVGKKEVMNGREMHWIRIDQYHEGNLDNPKIHHQPVMCMHCENAPCEPVCPVGATVHSDEGLNEMVYNRCVGTRYCANNCPYKVRRFNFYQYSDKKSESLKMMRNPEVTVRDRGVMEKCSFCVQRISLARIDAKKENRPIQDQEIVTACQASCPTQAITFGNLNDPKAQVTHLKESNLNYTLLEELNTESRLSYLTKIMNPNPKMSQHL